MVWSVHLKSADTWKHQIERCLLSWPFAFDCPRTLCPTLLLVSQFILQQEHACVISLLMRSYREQPFCCP
jgi:hypothetical protein